MLFRSEADIIIPNITEASFLTGIEYREEYDIGYIRELLAGLNDLGPGISVLTGVSLESGKTGFMGYERKPVNIIPTKTEKLMQPIMVPGICFRALALVKF